MILFDVYNKRFVKINNLLEGLIIKSQMIILDVSFDCSDINHNYLKFEAFRVLVFFRKVIVVLV